MQCHWILEKMSGKEDHIWSSQRRSETNCKWWEHTEMHMSIPENCERVGQLFYYWYKSITKCLIILRFILIAGKERLGGRMVLEEAKSNLLKSHKCWKFSYISSSCFTLWIEIRQKFCSRTLKISCVCSLQWLAVRPAQLGQGSFWNFDFCQLLKERGTWNQQPPCPVLQILTIRSSCTLSSGIMGLWS